MNYAAKVKSGVLTVSLLLTFCAHGQDPQWIKQFTGGWNEYAHSACTDSSGNIYVTGSVGGYFQPDGSVDGHQMDVATSQDIMLAKFAPDGTYQWAISPGGEHFPWSFQEHETGYDVRYNSISGRVVLVGSYESDLTDFGQGFTTTTGWGVFVAYYDPSGNCTALYTVPGGTFWGMTVDPSGNVYVQGHRAFDSTYFLAKLTSTGTLIWNQDFGYHIGGSWAADNGSLVLAGACYDDSELLGTNYPSTSPDFGSILARMDTAGQQPIDVVQYESDSVVFLADLELLPDGTMLTCGRFYQSLQLPDDTIVSSGGYPTFFLARLDSLGSIIWIDTMALAVETQSGIKLSVGADSTVYLVLGLRSQCAFGNFIVTPSTSLDFAVARYTWDGDCLGVMHGGPLRIGRLDIQSTPDGGVLLMAMFDSLLQIGPGLTPTLTDAFMAKFNAITGIEEWRAPVSDALHIYANPNNGLCTIDLPDGLQASNTLVLSVYDQTGQLVQQAPLEFTEQGLKLDVRAQAKGIYHVELSDGQQRYSGRIVFE